MNSLHEKVLIRPAGMLQILSQQEAKLISEEGDTSLNALLKQCILAVLNTGSKEDSGKALMEKYPDFHINVKAKGRGLQIELLNPPEQAFVDGEMIVGLQEHMTAVIRDLVYNKNKIVDSGQFDLNDSFGITNAIFHIARNAGILKPGLAPNTVVCWGGHSISIEEYKYTKHIGYELGLRNLDVCTGCGPGAMKGPMKGAVLGHGKQRYPNGRYIGITEPGIIAAEAPNAIVNELVIFPDIEKRLEAFMRIGHGIIIFPGGPGTMEELLYLLGVLLHPINKNIPFPVVLTAPQAYADYFETVKTFLLATIGKRAFDRIQIIIDDTSEVAWTIKQGLGYVHEYRKATSDAYYFNWNLFVPDYLQKPFEPTHENMASLNLYKNQEPYELAAQLRCAFSGIVAGNVKQEGIERVQKYGPYKLHGDKEIMQAMDKLLRQFVEQKRMKLDGNYTPCYELVIEDEVTLGTDGNE
jgi:predicted Rossmann-fold nucleotide-binding protein